jgi:hypothetical protein
MVVDRRSARRFSAAVGVALFVLLLATSAAPAAQPFGAVKQLSGKTGCFTYNGTSEDGASTCTAARGLAEGESAIVSPNGANVYVGSYKNTSAALKAGWAIFSRNASTGALKQLSGRAGCMTTDGASNAGPNTCTKARGFFNNSGDGHDMVITNDGKWAYVAGNDSPASLLIFHRNTKTGALTQLAGAAGCITTDGSSQDGAAKCKTDAHLLDASGLTFSSNEKFLYVTGTGGSSQIEVYSRNSSTGALTDLECIAQSPAPAGCSTGRNVGDTQFIQISPNGRHAYAGQYSKGISIYDRNPKTGRLTQKAGTAGCISNNGKDNTGAVTCAVGRNTLGEFPLLVSRDGHTLYNVDSEDGGFSTFHINGNGTLTQLAGTRGCTTVDGKDTNGASTCAIARAVDAPYGGVISPDGLSLYISNDDNPSGGGLSVFAVNTKSGVARQQAGLNGCITSDGTSNGVAAVCVNGRGLGDGYGMSISPDGHSIYQATDASSNAGLAIYSRTVPTLSGLRIVGMKIHYTLNVADTVVFTLKKNGHKLPGKITKGGKAGRNTFTFNGKFGGKTLTAGNYTLTATPGFGKPHSAKFQLTP